MTNLGALSAEARASEQEEDPLRLAFELAERSDNIYARVTGLNTAAHLIVFQILDGPNFGRILLEENPTQLFTVEGWELIIMLVYYLQKDLGSCVYFVKKTFNVVNINLI